MNESGRASGRASPTPPTAALSPLVKLLPKGYCNIQPFRKGQGWHSNGRPKRSKPSPRQPRGGGVVEDSPYGSPDRIVFPAIQGYEARAPPDDRSGPNASSVDETLEIGQEYARDEHEGEDEDSTRQLGYGEQSVESDMPSPRSADPVVRVTFRPMTPQHVWKSTAAPLSAPRRPSSVGCDPHGSASFRARALANTASAGCTGSSNNVNCDSRLGSPSVADVPASTEPRTKNAAVQSSLGDRAKRPTGPRSIADLVCGEDTSPPDPALVLQLWQEFNERAQAQRAIDRDEYHRKMQRKYNERKALREQVAQLERSLADTRRERDDLRQRLGSESADGYEEEAENETSSPVPSPHRSLFPSPRLSPRASIAPTTKLGHRERSFQLERALIDTKQQLVDTEELLSEQQTAMQSEIDDLKARLELEKRANTTLARQLLETTSSFRLMTDELMDTRVELETEQIARRMDSEQFEQRIQQLLVQHRQELVVADAKQALRNLGRQALQEKVKTFYSRAMVAEQRMRAAQEDAARLQQEVNSKQRSLEQLLSSRALRSVLPLPTINSVSCLAETTIDDSHQSIVLFHGQKTISKRSYLLHVVCEDPQSAIDTEDTSDGSEGLRIHFVVCDPISGQHDCITFRSHDIRRLVMDWQQYLAKNELGRRQRLCDLAALLLPHVHAGFKVGRLVLCEIPVSSSPSSASSTSDIVLEDSPVLREAVVYRGTQFVECCDTRSFSTVTTTAELTVNEVFSTQTPQHWWIEIHAVLVDGFLVNEVGDWDQQEDYVLKMDWERLVSICDQFGGYRPTSRLDKLPHHAEQDHTELMAVHEAMLWPLLDRLRVFMTDNGTTLRLGIFDDSSSSKMTPAAYEGAPLSDNPLHEPVEVQEVAQNDIASTALTTSNATGRTLDHRCILNVGGVFYCARFLELWDDELLLEVTLDDPESSVRLSGLLREQHLAAMAAHLHERGVVAEDFTSQLGSGLATELQAPLCKLLTKHLRKSRVDRHSPLAVSFASLFREIGVVSGSADAGSSGTSHEGARARGSYDTAPQSEVTKAQPVISALESRADMDVPCIIALECRDQLSEEQIHGLVLQIKTPETHGLRHLRRGVRLRGESGGNELALTRVYHGFRGFDGVVAVVFPVASSGDTNGARVVVMSEPFGPRALDFLGVERSAE